MHILKQNDYHIIKAQVLIIAVCISLHVVEIQLEAASSFTSAMSEIFANLILATAFKKVIATEQKLPTAYLLRMELLHVYGSSLIIPSSKQGKIVHSFTRVVLNFCGDIILLTQKQ
jgi:hypothetical protein